MERRGVVVVDGLLVIERSDRGVLRNVDDLDARVEARRLRGGVGIVDLGLGVGARQIEREGIGQAEGSLHFGTIRLRIARIDIGRVAAGQRYDLLDVGPLDVVDVRVDDDTPVVETDLLTQLIAPYRIRPIGGLLGDVRTGRYGQSRIELVGQRQVTVVGP